MDDVTKLPYLKLRGGVWYYRRRTPDDVREAVQKSEFVISLDTSRRGDAARKWRDVHDDVERTIEHHRGVRAALDEARDDVPAIHNVSEAPARKSGFRFYAKAAQQRAERRASGRDRTGRPLDKDTALWLARLFYADGTDWWLNEPADFDEAIAQVDVEIGELLDPNHIDTLMRTQNAADLLLDRHEFAGKPGDATYDLLTHYLRRAMLALARGRRDRLVNRFDAPPSDPEIEVRQVSPVALAPLIPSVGPQSTRTVKDAAEQFWKETRDQKAVEKKTRDKYRSHLDLVVAFLKPETAIATVTRDHCKAFLELLRCLPRNNTSGVKARSWEKVIAEALSGKAGKRIAHDTQKTCFRQYREFMGWASAEGLIANLNLTGLKVERLVGDEEDDDGRRPYTVEELGKQFSQPLFTGCLNAGQGFNVPGEIIPRDTSRYWLPLLGLWTGARLGEICQLRVRDIGRTEKGTPYIAITDDEPPMRLKTKNARRDVPIHPELEKLGFLEFVAERRAAGAHWLFKDMLIEGRDNSYRASKLFGSFLRATKLKTEDTCFHSFRHTFAKALKEARVPEQFQEMICGWSRKTMTQKYGPGRFADTLYEDVCKVRFEGLDLSPLYPNGAAVKVPSPVAASLEG